MGRYLSVIGKSSPDDGPLSLTAWFNIDDNSHHLTLIDGSGGAYSDEALLDIVDGKPRALLRDSASGPSDNELIHSADLADGLWHHVAMTWTGDDDDTLRLFVDGQLSRVQSQPAGTVGAWGWYVGRRYGTSTPDYFGGWLDDVRMYDRALSEGDVAELYALGVPEPGTLVLLASALLGLLLAAWARRR